jgi:hypothetical protein
LLTIIGEGEGMKTIAFAMIAFVAAAPATAAPLASRTFSVTGFDRIRIDGPFKVQLATGVAPYARASGTAAALDGVAIGVEGRTLVVRPSKAAWGGYPGQGRGPVSIMLGTHDLSTAWINGSGMLDVDKIKGLSFDLSVQGAGSAAIGNASVDQMKIGLSGSGTVRIAGTAPKLTAIIRGTSVLDGASLNVKDALIGAEGMPTVRANVSGTAKVDAQGLASVELGGAPACEVKALGSATVSGCR